jgi:sigma-E factor negative regulatory protein RseC
MDVRALVRQVEGREAVVELLDQPGSCGRCDLPGGCKSVRLTQVFGPSCRTYRLANTIGAQPGQQVRVRIADGAPLRAALAVYFLPVLFVIAGAAAGTALGGEVGADRAGLLGAAAGLTGAGVWIAFMRRRFERDPAARPQLVR